MGDNLNNNNKNGDADDDDWEYYTDNYYSDSNLLKSEEEEEKCKEEKDLHQQKINNQKLVEESDHILTESLFSDNIPSIKSSITHIVLPNILSIRQVKNKKNSKKKENERKIKELSIQKQKKNAEVKNFNEIFGNSEIDDDNKYFDLEDKYT